MKVPDEYTPLFLSISAGTDAITTDFVEKRLLAEAAIQGSEAQQAALAGTRARTTVPKEASRKFDGKIGKGGRLPKIKDSLRLR